MHGIFSVYSIYGLYLVPDVRDIVSLREHVWIFRQPNQLPSCQQSGQLKLSFFTPLAPPRFTVVEMSDEEARVFSFLIFGRVGICSTTRDQMLDPSRTPSMGQINEN